MHTRRTKPIILLISAVQDFRDYRIKKSAHYLLPVTKDTNTRNLIILQPT